MIYFVNGLKVYMLDMCSLQTSLSSGWEETKVCCRRLRMLWFLNLMRWIIHFILPVPYVEFTLFRLSPNFVLSSACGDWLVSVHHLSEHRQSVRAESRHCWAAINCSISRYCRRVVCVQLSGRNIWIKQCSIYHVHNNIPLRLAPTAPIMCCPRVCGPSVTPITHTHTRHTRAPSLPA